MSATLLLLTAFAASTAAIVLRYRHAGRHPHDFAPRASKPANSVACRRPSPAPAEMPNFEWESPLPVTTPKEQARAPAPPPENELRDAQRARIRDRYVAARFPGVARNVNDLGDTERIVRYARAYFEERKIDRALELLELAIECNPGNEALRLARLEIAFLAGDATLYVALANEFRIAHPESDAWNEVARLGREIAPEEMAFGLQGPDPHTRGVPNWTGATLDFTPDLRAEEFHRAMARRAAPGARATSQGGTSNG